MPQTQATNSKWQAGNLPYFVCDWSVHQIFKALPDPCIVAEGELETVFGMDNSEDVTGSLCSTEQQEPRTLEIGHLWNPLQQDSVLLGLLSQLSLNKIRTTEKSAWVSRPHIVGYAVSSKKQVVAIWEPLPAPLTAPPGPCSLAAS